MADLIIRGMEMPETCGLCKLCLDDSRICNGYCMFFHRRVNMMERDKNCPLLPLPEGHGRLIDADALFGVMGQDTDRWLIDDISYIETDDAISAVYKAPTIVPAEGGTDDG